jgi:hypothetical protein
MSLALVLMPLSVSAEQSLTDNAPQAVTIKKGDPAPFSGQLLTPKAAAKLVTAAEAEKKKAGIQVKGMQEKLELEKKLRQLQVRMLTESFEKTRQTLNDVLQQQNLPPPIYESWGFTFAVGVATGFAAIYAATQIPSLVN